MAAGELPVTRLSSEGGMSALFSMANGFVSNVLQTKTIGSLMNDQSISQLSDFQNVPVPDYLNFGIGFVVCGALGILLALVLPITGCGVACARGCKCCCSCCGGRKQHRELDHSRAKEFGCAGALLGITTLLFASVVCSYVATEMYRRELEPKTGALEDVLKGIKALDSYVDNTVDELNNTAVDGIADTKLSVFDIIDNLPTETRDRLGEETGVLAPLTGLAAFTSNLTDLTTSLANMDASATTLDTLLGDLSVSLSASRTDLNVSLTDCAANNNSVCQTALQRLGNLIVAPDFSGLVDTTSAQSAVNGAISANLPVMVNDGLQAFQNISNVIETETSGEMNNIKNKVNEVEDGVVGSINSLTSEISNFDLSGAMRAITDAKPLIDEYGHYIYAGLVSLNTVKLLIVTLLLIGVILGLLCPPPLPKAKGCESDARHGARVLLAASGFMFIFSWIVAIVVVGLLIAGGAGHTMLCRHVLTYDSSMESIEDLLWVEIRNSMDFSYNISFKQAMEECKENNSFYKAADAENNGINITEILDLDKYGIDELIDGLKNITIRIGSIDVLQDPVNASIVTLDQALGAVDFEAYRTELDKNVTATPLDDFAQLLMDIAALGISDSELFRNESSKLMDLHNTSIPIINEEKAVLRTNVDRASDIYSQPMTTLVNDLAIAEDTINADGNTIIKAQLEDYSDEILEHITNFTHDVNDGLSEDVGNCRSLYDAGVAMVYGPCVYILDPLNALWFCYGWFLIFSIPALILAIQLADIFKVTTPVKTAPEVVEMEPYGDSQHYALYYNPKGETTHYGVHDVKTISQPPPAARPTDYHARRHSANKVHPYNGGQTSALPASPPPAYGQTNGAPPSRKLPPSTSKAMKRGAEVQDYFRT